MQYGRYIFKKSTYRWKSNSNSDLCLNKLYLKLPAGKFYLYELKARAEKFVHQRHMLGTFHITVSPQAKLHAVYVDAISSSNRLGIQRPRRDLTH